MARCIGFPGRLKHALPWRGLLLCLSSQCRIHFRNAHGYHESFLVCLPVTTTLSGMLPVVLDTAAQSNHTDLSLLLCHAAVTSGSKHIISTFATYAQVRVAIFKLWQTILLHGTAFTPLTRSSTSEGNEFGAAHCKRRRSFGLATSKSKCAKAGVMDQHSNDLFNIATTALSVGLVHRIWII